MLKINNKVLKINSNWLNGVTSPEPPGPEPSLPPYTIRLKYKEGVTPTFDRGTGVQVSSSPNIWDLTYENSDWSDLLRSHSDLLEVIGGNTTGVTNMSVMFAACDFLTTVPLFDTSEVTNMSYMFISCGSLTSVPLFNTSKVTNMNSMLEQCYMVQSGALALYQQASSQDIPPSQHISAFYNCGRYTTTGSAELAQIPSDWKSS